MIRLQFTEHDAERAREHWRCNCGPSALAAVLDITLYDARRIVSAVDFERKGYMSPKMMMLALSKDGQRVKEHPRDTLAGNWPHGSLIRIQFTGDWMRRHWAERYYRTHWIAAFRKPMDPEGLPLAKELGLVGITYVFDVNGGLRSYPNWHDEVAPAIAESYEGSDGGWFVTHIWEVVR